ncbi:hypothetical protein [Kitasatospora sp. NPDC017646]|uniref:hypothetical protein n=1 Tax=Kitasatospora sp. NPDC017646 TaxID=3364024 RepID=UPI00378C9BE4
MRISRRWAEQLRSRRGELERLEAELTGCTGCVWLRRCRVLNPGDELATEGPGPRLLLPTEEH